MKMKKVTLEFKPQDCWVGVFWKRDLVAFGLGGDLNAPSQTQGYLDVLNIWICLVPMFPIHVRWIREKQL